jgi:hypothetical protein
LIFPLSNFALPRTASAWTHAAVLARLSGIGVEMSRSCA